MGNLFSNAKNYLFVPYKTYDRHPLLDIIKNPVNKFCDDFASTLVDDYEETTNRIHNMAPSNQDEIYGFTIVRVLGDGAEAVVYEAFKNRTVATPDLGLNLPIAIKKYKKVLQMGDGVPREFEIAKSLDHPHCLKMHECFKNAIGEYIISMPLFSFGSLSYSNVPVLTISAAALLMKQIGSAISYMHSKNIVHRDIKPSNVLLAENGFVLCDYSASICLKYSDELLSGIVGTSVFMAPEISNNPYSPKPCDIWAFGITVFVLLFGCFPYNLRSALEQNDGQAWNNTLPISQCVSKSELEFPEIPEIPSEMKNIISGMLQKDPKKRLTADQIAHNSWIVFACEKRNTIFSYLD